MLKSGVPLTMSVALVVFVTVPLIPVIVTGYVPGAVVELVVTENVDEDVAGLGAKLPTAPLGNPLALKVTWPVKPPLGVIVMP